MEFLQSAGRKARGALSTSIGSISFFSSDRLGWGFGSLRTEDGNQLLAEQAQAAELQPLPDLEAAVSNSSGGGDGEGRAGRGRGPTAASEEARVSNASISRTISELAVPMVACMGIYSTIHGADEQLQRLRPSLYFPLLTFLALGAYANLYSLFYALNITAGEGRGGGAAAEEREVVKREWLKVALTCTALALSFRIALGFY